MPASGSQERNLLISEYFARPRIWNLPCRIESDLLRRCFVETQSKRNRWTIFALSTLLLAGCSSSTPDTPGSAAKPGEKSGGLLSGLTSSTKPVVLPEGTPVRVTIETALSSDKSQAGDEFEATVAEAVVVDGKTVIPKGAKATGRVVEAQGSGRLKGTALLRLALRQVEVGGKNYDVKTGTVSLGGPGHTKRNAVMIGGGAGVGALIGGLAGGGKGAAIGAGVGAGAGTAGAAATGKKDVKVGAESRMTFKLSEALTVQVKN